ncbi:hypothetical protein LTR09_003239 [Extremus antarcticus]|uniref:NADP-dependent oxidoreductase domain-containing protein n=1 Tax=Extremus antarcticus TaxID=702011 RepID=A0AAJ0GEJ7_9PEZI|nr:hypothetical protein LTR09_003239 [Extremus antarcticus]
MRGGLVAHLRHSLHWVLIYSNSPAAAGLFAGNHKNIKTGDRFDTLHLIGQTYAKGYLKDNITAAVDRVIELVEKHGINGHAAALRWTVHHSKLEAERGHAVIIAASNVAQLNSNFDFIEQGPLPDEVLEAINRVHGEVAGSGFPYHA